MEELFTDNQTAAMDKTGNVVLDIESLAQSADKSTGSPKMTKALSRKGSSRIERRNGNEQEIDEALKMTVVKVGSQLEPLKQPLIANKTSVLVTTPPNCSNLADASDGRSKRFNRFAVFHPKKILLIFATLPIFIEKKFTGIYAPTFIKILSSLGTLILIYFTLAINKTG